MATIAAIVGAKLPDDAAEDSFNFLPIPLGEKPTRPTRDFVIYPAAFADTSASAFCLSNSCSSSTSVLPGSSVLPVNAG